MNLILAIVWFLLGVGVFAWEYFTGRPGPRILGGYSVAWLAIPLCLYNIARWWGEQSYQRQRRALYAYQDRRHRETLRERAPGSDIDPTFDFTAEAPPPRQTNLT